jgi:hypothetical protein
VRDRDLVIVREGYHPFVTACATPNRLTEPSFSCLRVTSGVICHEDHEDTRNARRRFDQLL